MLLVFLIIIFNKVIIMKFRLVIMIWNSYNNGLINKNKNLIGFVMLVIVVVIIFERSKFLILCWFVGVVVWYIVSDVVGKLKIKVGIFFCDKKVVVFGEIGKLFCNFV